MRYYSFTTVYLKFLNNGFEIFYLMYCKNTLGPKAQIDCNDLLVKRRF